jgi:hypothetical protein
MQEMHAGQHMHRNRRCKDAQRIDTGCHQAGSPMQVQQAAFMDAQARQAQAWPYRHGMSLAHAVTTVSMACCRQGAGHLATACMLSCKGQRLALCWAVWRQF